MSRTTVDVANMALARLGQEPISSLTESSNSARKMNFWLPINLDLLLGNSNWSFARKQQALALVTNDRSDQWDYKYDIPSDCVSFKHIVDPLRPRSVSDGDYPAFTLSNGSVYTWIENAIGQYIYRNDNAASWSPEFSYALSLMMARDASYALTKKTTLHRELMQEAKFYIDEAIQKDAGQEPNVWGSGNAYIEARGGTSYDPNENPADVGVDGSSYWGR